VNEFLLEIGIHERKNMSLQSQGWVYIFFKKLREERRHFIYTVQQ